MKIPISVIIITKNEEKNIEKCLKACCPVSEIFVVDSQSIDKTKEIAQKYIPEENIINFIWNGKWPKKKYWSILNLPINNEWVLMLDADEVPTRKLWNEVNEKIKEKKYDGCLVRFNYFFMGKMIRHGDAVKKICLFKYTKVKYEDDGIRDLNWDVEGHINPLVNGKVGIIKNRIIHNDFKGFHNYFERHNRYSDWEAKLIVGRYYRLKNKNFKFNKDIFLNYTEYRRLLREIFLCMPFRPLLYFLYAYFFKLGFLDGKFGFYYILCKCFYLMQIELKVKELKQKNEPLRN